MEVASFTAKRLLQYFESQNKVQFPACAILMDGPLDLGADKLSSGRLAGLKFQNYSNGMVAVRAPGMGAAAVAYAIEILSSLGVKQILHLGTVGALTSQVNPGELLIVSGAIADEGVSREYGAPDVVTASLSLPQVSKIRENLWRQPSSIGVVWSTSAVFRETPDKIKKYRELGASAVDMEASAVLAVSAALGIEALCLRIVSDSFGETGEWNPAFKSDAVKSARRELWQMALSGAWR